jgi:hypothetical protein
MDSETRTIERLERIGEQIPVIQAGERWSVHLDGTSTSEDAFAHSVARGLSDHPRWLHCRYLYDAEGSRIFSQITEQPEYYLTGAESEILATRSDEIRELAGAVPIVELGAGSATKTRHLLDAWSRAAAGGEFRYVPLDIDRSVLTRAARELAESYDGLQVTGLAMSYERGLDAVRGLSPMCLVFLGSTIGNFNPEETDAFLARVVEDYIMRLISTGTVIPREVLPMIEHDLREEVLEMLRKKTYGHFSLADFRRAKANEPTPTTASSTMPRAPPATARW